MRTPSPPSCRLDLAPPLADRFLVGVAPIDYSPVLLLMPFGFHLAVDTLPSGEPQVAASGPPWLVSSFRFRARLGFSMPSTFPGPRGITPAFGYDAPHPSAGGTSTLLNNALLSAHYEPLGLPPGSVRLQPSGLIPTVFVRPDCQAGSLLFRAVLSQRATAPNPAEVQHPIRLRDAVCCLRRAMSGSTLRNTFRLIM